MIEFDAPEELIISNFEEVTDRVTDKEIDVLKLLYENPKFTSANMASKLDVSRKTILNRLKSLKDKGVIERIGSDNKGYWKIKQ